MTTAQRVVLDFLWVLLTLGDMQRTTVTLIDDTTGEEANETVSFGLDSSELEIDLTAANAQKLRDTLAPYIASARRMGRATSRPQATSSRTQARSREESQKIRDWLREAGYQVSDRGRISNELFQAYRSGTPAPQTLSAPKDDTYIYDQPAEAPEPGEEAQEEKPKRSRRKKEENVVAFSATEDTP